MAERTNRLIIRTPEGIAFSLLLAGPAVRFLAVTVDFVAVLVIWYACTRLLLPLIVLVPGVANAVSGLLLFLIMNGYSIVLEWFWNGQSLGKWLFRLRVVDETGLRLEFYQVVVRNLLRVVDVLPLFYLVGGVSALISRRSQRLGDIAANTIVVRTPKLVQPDLERVLSDKYNSFREYPHLVARLRQSVSPDLARVALQALIRRNDLDPDARLDLFDTLARRFRDEVRFPEEATFGLTDEQYVRNVVDIIYREDPRHTPRPAATPAARPAHAQAAPPSRP